jgi:hypothetical protein
VSPEIWPRRVKKGGVNINSNQRFIHHKKAISNEANPFTYFNLEALGRAMRELKPATFKLWCYFNKNRDDYESWTSWSAINKYTGLSRTSYYNAFKELQDKGYITDFYLPIFQIEGFLFLEDAGRNTGEDIFNTNEGSD